MLSALPGIRWRRLMGYIILAWATQQVGRDGAAFGGVTARSSSSPSITAL
jgi:hypothetical protein